MPLKDERCFKLVILTIIAISAVIVSVGIYIGIALKNIILMSSILVLIILILGLVTEFTELFKDRLNEKQLIEALSLDVSKLKKNTS